MSEIKKCLGCGAILQQENENHVGFTKDLNMPYCMDCFRLKNYGKSDKHYHPSDLPIIEENSLIFMMSSVLHLDLLFTYPVYRYQPNAKYTYIINQMDLLPKDTNLDYILEKITKKAFELNIPFEDIIFMSSNNKKDIENIKAYIEELPYNKIYLLGVQNSGKTTLFKALTNHEYALNIKKAGLTQEALKGKFLDKEIIDMPGLYQGGYLHTFLEYEVYDKLIPEKQIRPKIYQMKNNDALMIEGLIGISFKGPNSTFVLYLDNHINVEKTNEKRIKERLKDKEKQFKIYATAYEEKAFKINSKNKMQITFADMGFLIIEENMTVKVTYPKGMHISLTESYLK